MTMNINKRKRPSSIEIKEFKKTIKIIKDDFKVDWLNDDTNSSHPLVVLFRCDDYFASIQLIQLGYCLRKIKSINRIWYDKVIEDIKTTTSKTRADILEMLVASMFHHPPERIVELPNSLTNEGWDVKVKLDDGYEIYIQVKNNGETTKFQEDKKVLNIEEIVVKHLQSRALKLMIFKNDDKYPDDLSWAYLIEKLPSIMHGAFEKTGIEIEGGWKIKISDLRDSLANIHSSRASYELLLAMPISRKEKDSLLSRITDACSCLGIKRADENEKSIYIALVRVPVEAPFKLCGILAHQYFEDSPTHRASGILFYKSSVATDTKEHRDYFAHAFHLVLRDSKWDLLKIKMPHLFEKIDIGIGRGLFSIDGINENDIYNHLDMGDCEMRIEDAHLYQSGQINYLMRNSESHKINRRRGIKVHIYYIDSDQKEKRAPINWIADDEPLLF